MKLKQKIGFGLVLITALLAGLFFSHSSSAAPSFTATWVDRSTIEVTGEGKDFVVTDGNWDGNWRYEGAVDGCSSNILNDKLLTGVNGFDSDLVVGFGKYDIKGRQTAEWSTASTDAGNFVVNYRPVLTGPCTPSGGNAVKIINSLNAEIAFRYTDEGHDTIARIDDGGSWTFGDPKIIPTGQFNAGMTRFFRQSDPGGNDKCQDKIDVSGGTMRLYEQKDKKNGGSPVEKDCELVSTINNLDGGGSLLGSKDVVNNAVPSNYPLPLGDVYVPPDTGGGGGVGGTNDACYKSGWELAWVACPVITAAQTAANAMYGFVEDQLKFTVLQNCPSTVTNCADSLGQEHDNVHNAWSNFRVLVSGLVVILLLVMVISQAIGVGPFDAYTVKKMLPRLVMGVVLIQISWPIFSWVVNTVDHLGVGLAELMYAPFGGADALNLNAVLQPFVGTAIAFSWVGIPAMVIFGVVAPFVVLGLILSVLAALFFGFLTLLFRKIIIILALIFVPLALISWMMPNDGLRIYWKKWWENFSKALMMFPLIIAIIAAGRIFAKIGSAQSDFVGFFIVLVGFFGPLFILPKTFKWGGTAVAAVGNGLSKAQTATLKKPKEFLTSRQEGYSAERKRQSQERVGGKRDFGKYRKWYQSPLDKFRSGKWDPTLGGQKSRRKFEATAGYAAAGRESSGKTYETAKNAAQQLFDTAKDHDYAARMLMRGGEFDYVDKAGVKQHYTPPKGPGGGYMRAAGAAGLAKYGTDRGVRTFQAEIDRMRAKGGQDALLAEEILDELVTPMKPKMDSMYRGFDTAAYNNTLEATKSAVHPEGDQHAAIQAARLHSIHSSVDSMKEDWFATMEPEEARSLLAGLSTDLASTDGHEEDGSGTGDKRREKSRQMLTKFWELKKVADATPTIQVSAGINKSFKAWADGNPGAAPDSGGSLTEMNDRRTTGERIDKLKEDEKDEATGLWKTKETDVPARPEAALGTISRDGGNQALIDALGVREYMDDYDGNGAPITRGQGAQQAAATAGETEVRFEHEETPPPEIITPDHPDFRPPSSSDLPR